jgi:hypothetical protein
MWFKPRDALDSQQPWHVAAEIRTLVTLFVATGFVAESPVKRRTPRPDAGMPATPSGTRIGANPIYPSTALLFVA